MKSLMRLCLAATIVFLSHVTVLAVTEQECNDNCTADQYAAAQACYSSCASECESMGPTWRIHYNIYIDEGCHVDPTQSYCVVEGDCICYCEQYI
ncbi:MAG: hypothetical protein R2745_02150 [Vicinamibacterales bacterium]